MSIACVDCERGVDHLVHRFPTDYRRVPVTTTSERAPAPVLPGVEALLLERAAALIRTQPAHVEAVRWIDDYGTWLADMAALKGRP